MSANAHDMARTGHKRSGADADYDANDLGSLDRSLSHLEQKLAALQGREQGREHGRDAATPAAPPVARRVRVGAPSLDRSAFDAASAHDVPAPHAALQRIESSFAAAPAPARPAPADDAVTRGLERLRQDVSGEIERGVEGLARRVDTLREAVAAGRGPDLQGEFGRVYRGLEAVADALDQQGDTKGMVRDVAALKADLDALARQGGTQADALDKLVKSQNAVLQAQSAIERSLATHRTAIDPELAAIRAQIEEVSRRVGSDKSAIAIEGLDKRLVALGKALGEVKRVAGEGPDLRALEAKLEDLARVVVAAAQSVPEIDVAPIERIEARVASHHRRVDERDKRREEADKRRFDATEDRLNAIQTDARATGETVRALASGLEGRIAERLDGVAETMRDEHGRLAMDVVAATGPRFEAVAHAVERVGGEVEGWSDRLDGWGQRLEKEMGRPRDAEVNMFKALAARLDAVSDRLAELPDASNDATNFRAIEARVGAVMQRLDQIGQGSVDREAIDELRSQLGSIAWRIEQPAEAPAALTTLDARVQAMSSRLEALSAANQEIASNVEAVAARPVAEPRVELDDATLERIGLRVENSLTQRLDELTAVLNRTTAPIAELAPRLDALEETMGDAQVALVETARSAAAEVVSAMLESQGDMVPAEAEAVAALDGDIRRLEELTVGQDERNNKTFDAVHETLLKIVDRLDQLDTMVARATEAPDPAVMAATHAALMQSGGPVAPAAGAAPSLMDRLRGRAAPAPHSASPAGPEASDAPLPFAAPAASDPEDGSIFADLDPDTPLDPLTGNPGFAGAPDAADDGPTVDGILANVRGDGGVDDGEDFMSIARARMRADEDADFTGALDGDPDGAGRGKAPKGASKGASKGRAKKGAKGAAGGDKPQSALARHRRPLLMAAAVAIAALIAMPQIVSTVEGVLEGPGVPTPAAVPVADIDAATADDAGTGIGAELDDEAIALATMGEDVGPAEAGAPDPSGVVPDAVPTVPGAATVDPIETRAVEPLAAPREDVREVSAAPARAAPVATNVSGPVFGIAFQDTDGPASLREAAKGGDARALHEIAGRIATTDAARAFALYKAAAERGLAPSQYRLGQAYEKGYGTEIDLGAARRWYGVAAEAGNASAMHNLAVLYAMGADGARDVTLAGRWFTEAANLGITDSQYNLGILHAQGSGVSEDLVESYKWFDAAAKGGDADAGIKRDEVGGALSPSQLAAAKARAAAWSAAVPAVETNRVVVPEAWRAASLKPADMTRAVRNVQAILNRSGFDAGTPDGVMGKKTRTAILEFQRANGLPVSGEIDDALVRALLEKNAA